MSDFQNHNHCFVELKSATIIKFNDTASWDPLLLFSAHSKMSYSTQNPADNCLEATCCEHSSLITSVFFSYFLKWFRRTSFCWEFSFLIGVVIFFVFVTSLFSFYLPWCCLRLRQGIFSVYWLNKLELLTAISPPVGIIWRLDSPEMARSTQGTGTGHHRFHSHLDKLDNSNEMEHCCLLDVPLRFKMATCLLR